LATVAAAAAQNRPTELGLNVTVLNEACHVHSCAAGLPIRHPSPQVGGRVSCAYTCSVRLLVLASPNQPANSAFLLQKTSTSQPKPAPASTSEHAHNLRTASSAVPVPTATGVVAPPPGGENHAWTTTQVVTTDDPCSSPPPCLSRPCLD